MAEDALSLRFGIDSSDAIVGVEKVTSALGKTAEATKTADAGANELTGALKDKLTPATEAAYNAFEKLSKAQTPRALQQGILDAEIAMEGFKRAADAAAASGTAMPPKVTAALRTMQGDVDAATKKLGQMRDAMGDVKTRADAMGQGWSQAASSGGSLNSMLENLEATTGGLTRGLVRGGLAVGGIAAAFHVGYTAGKEFSSFMKDLGVDVNVSSKRWSDFAFNLSKVAGDTKVGAWLRDLGDSTRNYSALLTPLPGKMNEQMKAHQLLARAIEAENKELKSLGLSMQTSAQAEAHVIAQLAAFQRGLDLATRSGEDLDKFAKTNAGTIQTLIEAMQKQNIALDLLDPKMQTVILLHNAMTEAAKHAAQSTLDAAAALDAETKAAARMAKEVNDASAAENAAIKKRNADIDEEIAQTQKLTDALGRLAHGLTAVGAASDHATDGLEGVAWAMRKATPVTVSLNDAQNELIESLAKISDAGGASSLWVGHLIAQLESGEIGFDAFTQKVNQLLQELTKLGPVMGNTAGELNAINTLLSAFKNNSTEGWPSGGKP